MKKTRKKRRLSRLLLDSNQNAFGEHLKPISTSTLLRHVDYRMKKGFCPKSRVLSSAIAFYLKKLATSSGKPIFEDG